MKTLMLISSLLFAVSAFAKDLTLSDWQKATVKVNSHSRLWSRPNFAGSGTLVWAKNHAWVLTSEHVLFNPGTYDSVVEIMTVKGKRVASEMVSDYLKGMSVLAVYDPDIKDIAIPIEDLVAAGASPSTVTALGFPVASNALQTLNGGEVKNAQSPRALIPGIRSFIEVDRLPVEYGMSGGALLNSGAEQTLTYAGMISHQYLKRQQGQPTQLHNSTEGNSATAQDLLLAIPAREVVAFFNSVIAQEFQQQKPRTWRHSLNTGVEQLTYGPLTFTLREEGTQEIWKIGGGDAGGVGGRGGGDGGGVGGGDGGGVGGNKNVDFTKFQSIRVELSGEKETANLPYPEMEKWISWIKSGREVRIMYLRPKQGGRLTRIGSLDKFLTAWLRDGEEPVAIRSLAGDSRGEEVQQAAREVIKAVKNSAARVQSETRLSWLSGLRELAVQAEAGMIGSRQIKTALGGASTATWESYYTENFDGAVALEGALEALVEKMKALGL